jgi:cytochrome b pre-mRNA-processing protein 3
MIWPLLRRAERESDTISTLYGTIVAQARLPCFYRGYGVADTINGRFDLIVLHLTLVLDRLFGDPALRGQGQGLFDRFCRDMDDNLREMGIGDLSVPKEMRTIGDAFYGRSRAYMEGLKAGPDVLSTVIARNIYGGSTLNPDASRDLAAYVIRIHDNLHAQGGDELSRGVLRFPDPTPFLGAAH